MRNRTAHFGQKALLGLAFLLLACDEPKQKPILGPDPTPNPPAAQAPAVPGGFAFADLGPGSVTLRWEAAAGAQDYTLERGQGSAPSSWTPLALSAPAALTHADTGLAASTFYNYRLRANNAAGSSEWASLSLTTPASPPPPLLPPSAPADFAASGLTAGGVRLSWSAVPEATRYALERGLGASPAAWTPLALPAPAATGFDDETLEPATAYRYRLRSSNAAGDSDWAILPLTTPAAPPVRWRIEPWVSSLRDPNNASSPDVVWSMRFTPDLTRMLYTPRDRTRIEVRSIDVATKAVTTIPGDAVVRDENFAGILGMTLDPDFARNSHLYICYSTFVNGTQRRNRVSRFTLGSRLTDERELLILAGGFTQNGCRVIFGPDGKLYATMGYTGDFSIAQDLSRMGGKILRINPDGTIPADNPYRDTPSDNPSGNAIWSFGHRNPQGIAFRPGTNQLWSTEHGENTRDELNLIVRGQNYGWPLCAGTQPFNTPMFVANEPAEIQNFRCTGPNLSTANYQPAIRQYEPDGLSSIAPSNLIFYTGRAFLGWRGNLFFLTLRTGRLYRLTLEGDRVASEELLIRDVSQYGRLRDILVGPEGYIYFSNDGGTIYRIVPN